MQEETPRPLRRGSCVNGLIMFLARKFDVAAALLEELCFSLATAIGHQPLAFGDDLANLERALCENQNVSVVAVFELPLLIELEDAGGVRRHKRQRKLQRDAVLYHQSAELPIENVG